MITQMYVGNESVARNSCTQPQLSDQWSRSAHMFTHVCYIYTVATTCSRVLPSVS